jgi:penicillin-binding protein A
VASGTSAERRRRITRRALPALGGLAVVALAVGAAIGSLAGSAAERTARDFTRAWERGDLAAMHDLLTSEAQSRYNLAAFRRAYREAAATATATAIRAASPRGEDGDVVPVPITVRTRLFGPLRGELRVPVPDEDVAWAPHLTFPAVPEGARLTRRSDPPERARLLSRDRKVLAEGPADARSSPLGGVGASVAGGLEPEEQAGGRERVYARGLPRSWPVGQSGLERIFEDTLAGRPGGELLAGGRVLARAAPRAGRDVKTTIDARLQESAVGALGGRLGGIAALDARTAQVRALAGIAFSAPQPPGSTFKIVTTTAALEAKAVKTSTNFPVDTKAVIDGVDLENANGESCGGTFQNSFAHSCNSVFAPLGVKVGARRLVDAAERYGFNGPPALPGEVPSTIPPADEIRTPLEVGSSAIGQFKVQATPLRLASMAQAVAAGGVRREPTLRPGERRPRVRVTSRRVARTLERLMIDVVAYGTGTAGAVPGVQVAGKTGTAELKDTRGPNAETTSDPENTDAWFTAYAPADRPRIAAAALFVRAGAGGQTAAPAVQLVLATALGK